MEISDLMLSRPRTKRRPPPPVPPTPETVAKLGPDPLRVLVDQGLIDSDGERAAHQIRVVYLAVTRAVLAMAHPPGDDPARGRYEMPDDMARAYTDLYKPWVAAQGPAVVDAVLTLVVDRQAIPRSKVGQVVDALGDYAQRMERG